MKKLIFILFSLILFPVMTESLDVIRVVSSPKDFYVGDMVTLHIYIETPFDGELNSPAEIPEGDWLNINSINLIESGPEESVIRMSFTSFSPGLRVVPDIEFGDHVLHDFKVQTLSILDDRFTELQPISPQMVPPGTNLLLVFVLLGLVFGPYLIFILIKTLFYSLKLAIKKYKREKPYRDYVKVLKSLKVEIESITVRDFYVKITEQLRIYLSVRFNKDFSSATTMEMGTILLKIMDDDSTEELLSICRFADLVKFSHTNASTMHREKDLRTIVEIVNQLEGKEKNYARF